MTQSDPELEAGMAPEERELVEKYRKKVGEKHTPPNDQEAMNNEVCIYFWGLGAEATWTWIKRWATVNEDYNSLWFDEEYAKKSQWQGLIAPPLYLISVHDGLAAPMEFFNDLMLPGGLNPNREKYPNLYHTPQGETEWEFYEPVRPGDFITADHHWVDLYWKKAKPGRPFTRLLFNEAETTFTNQKGQLVGHNRSVGIVTWK
jgi:acyl dehydratase